MFTSSSARHAASNGGHGTLSHLASMAALAALVGASWHSFRSTHERRLSARPRTKPEREQVWEDEGGESQMPKSPAP